MGLFSSKKVIEVSSTLYNMAGEVSERNNFLKSSMFSLILSPQNHFIGEQLSQNYLQGPGIKQRQFFNWADRNDFVGMPDVTGHRVYNVDPVIVAGQIPASGTLSNQVQTSFIMFGDFEPFAEAYLLANDPEEIVNEWVSEYHKDSHEITIQYEGGSTVTFSAGEYDPNGHFVVANYYQTEAETTGSVNTGSLVEDEENAGNLPDDTGHNQDSQIVTSTSTFTNLETETTEEITYSDSTPGSTNVSSTFRDEDYNNTTTITSGIKYTGGDGVGVTTTGLKTINNLFESGRVDQVTTITVVNTDMGGGVTRTTTTTTVTDTLFPIWDYRVDTQDVEYLDVVGGTQIFIYKIGTGNIALDGLKDETLTVSKREYFPFIPVRLDNVSITEFPDLYADSKLAYRRASSGQKLDDIIAQVEDNEDIDEIDYSYVVFGVSANTTEAAAKRYMYLYLQSLIPFQNTDDAYFDTFKAGVASYESILATHTAWVSAQGNPMDPLYGTVRPTLPSLAQPEVTTIQTKSTDPETSGFDNRISWVSMHEDVFSGSGKPGALKGDVWFEDGTDFTWSEEIGIREGGSDGDPYTYRSVPSTIEQKYLFWQVDDDSYRRMTINGLIHQNFIYEGKSVDITLGEALDDDDTSGFILPLHYPTIKSMGIVDATQMATANTFIVFNSYLIYKKKWYESFLGFLFIILLVVALGALIAPGSIGGISGILGQNLAVGTALGLSGTAAVVAGAVANALAAVVLSQAVSKVSVTVFGEKWGSIISAIATFALNFGFSNGFSNFNFSTVFSAENLLGLTNALANGYSGWAQAEIGEIYAEMETNENEYETEMDKIQAMLEALGLNNDLSFNPLALTDAVRGNVSPSSYTPESSDEFIHRTTMTGSDIVEITIAMVTDFADLSLELPKK